MANQVGKTKEAGFQFGVRKTISASSEKVWDFLFSEKGLRIWLGNLKSRLDLDKEFETKDGVVGLIRVFKPNSHIRLNWKTKSWKNMSTVQVRVIENGNKTTIAIHQEKLLNSEQRNEMKEYWTKIIEKLSDSVYENV